MKGFLCVFFLVLLTYINCFTCPFNFGSTNLEILALSSITNTGPSVITGIFHL